MRLKKLRGFFKEWLVLAGAALCCAAALLAYNAPLFAGGENYAFYTAEHSSARIILSDAPFRDRLFLSGIAGESAQYEGDCARELIVKFRAELCFTEEACGVVSYYLYSPLLKEGVELSGYAVNLHIAVKDGRTAVGSPLIFGGF